MDVEHLSVGGRAFAGDVAGLVAVVTTSALVTIGAVAGEVAGASTAVALGATLTSTERLLATLS